ncbi:hypothetical protein M407DRAFT_9698 [Tulasnella calospora MUT 4182]|uniref:Uncharacterized protein n=1 Tax=Tulasnella calospora MUT 4182 TaxID=1051891 RepID=A0A0C3QC92_9AGAM|nr:hypothetical protein M407DRAFT_9698 [Tulasnella calospora MUT 4182]
MRSLLNDVHDAKNARLDIKTARKNLRHYIYMYCACGIWQRVTVLHFFLAKNGTDLLLNKEAFDVKPGVSLASHLLDQDETWLKELLCIFDQTGNVEYKLEEVPVGNSKAAYHLFATGCIRHVHRSTFEIMAWILTPQPGQKLSKENRQRTENNLDEMQSTFYRLYKLLHHSPSFWRLVDLLGIISLEKVKDLKRYRFKYKEHSHTRLAEDSLVDGAGLSPIHTFSDIPKKWSVEQARGAIKARATEPVQAMKLQTQVEAIAMDAKTGKAVPPTIHDRQLKALKILADFSEEAMQDWEEAFEGCVHCKANLACRMYLDDRNICEELIGVSKRCCFCCDSALLALYPHLKGVSSHGKVCHWAPPPGTPGFVKEAVLFELKIEFDRFVRHYLHPKY